MLATPERVRLFLGLPAGQLHRDVAPAPPDANTPLGSRDRAGMPYARDARSARRLRGPHNSRLGADCDPSESGWRRGTAVESHMNRTTGETSLRRVMHCPVAALQHWGTPEWITGDGPPDNAFGNRFYGKDEAPFHRELRHWINASVEHEVREMMRAGIGLKLTGDRVTLRAVYDALNSIAVAGGGFRCDEETGNGGISETMVVLASKGPRDPRTHVAVETQPAPTLYAYESSGVGYAPPPPPGGPPLQASSIWLKEPWETALSRGMLRGMLVRSLHRLLNAELLRQCEVQFGQLPLDVQRIRQSFGLDITTSSAEARAAMMRKFSHYSMRPYVQTRVLLLTFTRLAYGQAPATEQRTPLQEAVRVLCDALKDVTDERLFDRPGHPRVTLWDLLRQPIPPGGDIGELPRFRRVWRSLNAAASAGAAGGELELVELNLATRMMDD